MGTCSTCARVAFRCADWLGVRRDWRLRARCARRHEGKLGLCQAIRDEDHNGDEQEAAGVGLAQATDLSGFAALRTAASFGCVLHVAKGSA